MGAIWLLVGLGVAALLYWMIVIGEGTYLGPWAVRLVYRWGARHYDTIRSATHAQDEDRLLPLLRAALAGRSAPQVLDVATGTGRVPLLLASDRGFTGSIIGLDLTAQMLDLARQKQAQMCPQAAIHWQQGEASQLAWPDDQFDLVCCLEAIEYFPRPRQALAEMVRVLQPGGSLILSKWTDDWARFLPGRALNEPALRQQLHLLGLESIQITPWQSGAYELVRAIKAAHAAVE
ncbi:methyltransferase type 11 [Oscillochloris trichoides DG-6]|uniref:Methyltransferase type 11 n=1 Tax=Oscillochloris trichoides DG-6 TaxID=765420 RepID=E1IEC0_9CHLR|nr:class I SAM-dependent methyltransferase [Oscillochloris trichoides]EFO80446.1 methyltransferase type 11 [Oscillochloris trichoides DG-6]